MAGRGHLGGRVHPEGTRVVDGQVGRRILVASTEGGEAKGGGHREERQLPWLSDMGNRLHQRVSNLLLLLLLLMVSIGQAGEFAGHAWQPSGCAQHQGRTQSRCPRRRHDMEEGAVVGRSRRGRMKKR